MWRVIVVLAVVTLALVAAAGQPAWAVEWSPPVSGASIALPFGAEYSGRVHRGVDLPAEAGAAVQAPTAGWVAFAGTVPADGGGTCNAVTIETAEGYKISLLPLDSVQVQAGASVCAGDAVGRLAASGDDSSESPHLHLGLRQGDRYIDPAPMLSCGDAEEPVTPPVPDTAPEPSAEPVGSTLPDGVGLASYEPARASASVPLPQPAAASPGAHVPSALMTTPRPESADLEASLQRSTTGAPSHMADAVRAIPEAMRATRLAREAGVSASSAVDLDSAHAGVTPGGTTWVSRRTVGVSPVAQTPVAYALVALATATGAVMPIIARSKALVRAR